MTSCRNCQARWAQWKGLCRRCGKQAGIFTDLKSFEAARVSRNQPNRSVPTAPARIPNIRVIDGVEFKVVFP